MGKMQLKFTHKKKLSKEQIKTCNKVINEVIFCTQEQPWVSGSWLSKQLNMHQAELRKNIQIIREYNELFFTDMYLIASVKGYQLTKNKAKILKFAKSIHTRGKSALAQVDQAYKIAKESW